MSVITTEIVAHHLKRWESLLGNSLWYEKVMPELVELWKGEYAEEQKEVLKESLHGFFEQKLYGGKIALAADGPDFDQWRKPVDTIVIHHTSGESGVSWKRLSTIGFLRQYAHDYYRYDDQYGIITRGQAIWSNHFRVVDGKKVPVFYAYHWIVRSDGTYDRLLNDDEIGWQSGNGEINFRSVAIVLDGTFTDSVPDEKMLQGIRELINTHYPQVEKERIFGHREVNPKTVCPGNLFLGGWKKDVIE